MHITYTKHYAFIQFLGIHSQNNLFRTPMENVVLHFLKWQYNSTFLCKRVECYQTHGKTIGKSFLISFPFCPTSDPRKNYIHNWHVYSQYLSHAFEFAMNLSTCRVFKTNGSLCSVTQFLTIISSEIVLYDNTYRTTSFCLTITYSFKLWVYNNLVDTCFQHSLYYK